MTDTTSTTPASGDTAATQTWQMWARPVEGTQPFLANPSPDRRYVQAYCNADQQPIEVTVAVDNTGQYHGWIDTDGSHPVMIQPDEMLFRMQFPYGPKIEEESGNGTAVRLTIKPTTDEQGTDR